MDICQFTSIAVISLKTSLFFWYKISFCAVIIRIKYLSVTKAGPTNWMKTVFYQVLAYELFSNISTISLKCL